MSFFQVFCVLHLCVLKEFLELPEKSCLFRQLLASGFASEEALQALGADVAEGNGVGS